MLKSNELLNLVMTFWYFSVEIEMKNSSWIRIELASVLAWSLLSERRFAGLHEPQTHHTLHKNAFVNFENLIIKCKLTSTRTKSNSKQRYQPSSPTGYESSATTSGVSESSKKSKDIVSMCSIANSKQASYHLFPSSRASQTHSPDSLRPATLEVSSEASSSDPNSYIPWASQSLQSLFCDPS